MNNILAACLLSSLIACTLDDPYMPVNPEEKPAPPVVTEYQPIALTIGANGRFDVSGSSVKIGLNGKNSTYGVCLPQIAQGHFIAEVTADKTTNFGLAIVREKNGKPDFNNYTSVSVCTESGVSTVRVLDRQDGIDNVLRTIILSVIPYLSIIAIFLFLLQLLQVRRVSSGIRYPVSFIFM